jgi:hypothetical protein
MRRPPRPATKIPKRVIERDITIFAKPVFGSFPVTGPSPFLGPVTVADAILERVEDRDIGADVLTAEDIPRLDPVGMPVPGRGAMEGAEKLVNPLGRPVSLGSLSVSYNWQ